MSKGTWSLLAIVTVYCKLHRTHWSENDPLRLSEHTRLEFVVPLRQQHTKKNTKKTHSTSHYWSSKYQKVTRIALRSELYPATLQTKLFSVCVPPLSHGRMVFYTGSLLHIHESPPQSSLKQHAGAVLLTFRCRTSLTAHQICFLFVRFDKGWLSVSIKDI